MLFVDNVDVAKGKNKTESCGGIYISPMSLPSKIRNFPSSMHTFCLTPPTVKSKAIMNILLDDLVPGIRTGIESTIFIFLDPVGYLADFHEAADGTVAYNHGGNTGCNLCMFRKNNFNTSSSKFAYSVLSHSRNLSLQRTLRRHVLLKSFKLSKSQEAFLGISNTVQLKESPLMLLQEQIDGKELIRHVPDRRPASLKPGFRTFLAVL